MVGEHKLDAVPVNFQCTTNLFHPTYEEGTITLPMSEDGDSLHFSSPGIPTNQFVNFRFIPVNHSKTI